MTLQELLNEARQLTLRDQVFLATRLLELVEQQVNSEKTAITPSESISADTPIRKPGLHPGAFVISDDFDEPLPDSFWLGEA